MKHLVLPWKLGRGLAALPLVLYAAGALAQVAGVESLASFGDRGPFDGLIPSSPVLFDAAGNLYGTTVIGGRYSGIGGIMFKMSKKVDGTWTRRTLFDFNYLGGYQPAGQLAMDPAGNLYGTTAEGGADGAGAVYELIPKETGRWTEKVLFNFPSSAKAFSSVSGVIRDGAGNLFAALSTSRNNGSIFEISPRDDGQWTATSIHSFDSTHGGPISLTMNGVGDLYGVTANSHYGGVVFRLAPPPSGKTLWSYTTLHTFPNDGPDGRYAGRIILDSVGNIYGTTALGGAYNQGTVFEVPAGQGADGADRILYSFGGDPRGYGAYQPIGVTFEPSGNLIGVTFLGGPGSTGGGVGGGKAFEMSPQHDGTWKVRALHNFGSFAVPFGDGYKSLDGFSPSAPLVVGPDGNYYGVTDGGGYADVQAGTVFKLVIH